MSIDESCVSEFTHDQLQLLNTWRQSSSQLAVEHAMSADQALRRHLYLFVPTLIIPLVMAPLDGLFLGGNTGEIISRVAFLVSAVCASLSAFFSFAKKNIEHDHASAAYKDLVVLIESELAKSDSMRKPTVLLIQQVRHELRFLEHMSPQVSVHPISTKVMVDHSADTGDTGDGVPSPRSPNRPLLRRGV